MGKLDHAHPLRSNDIKAYEECVRDFNAIRFDNEIAIRNLQSRLANTANDEEKALLTSQIMAREATVKKAFEKTAPIMEQYNKTCAQLAVQDGGVMKKKWLSAWREESLQMENVSVKGKRIFRIGNINGKIFLIGLGLVGFS